MTNLKPCPFCGGSSEYYPLENKKYKQFMHWIDCINYNQCGVQMSDPNKNALFVKWNTRTPAPEEKTDG